MTVKKYWAISILACASWLAGVILIAHNACVGMILVLLPCAFLLSFLLSDTKRKRRI